MGWSTKEPQGEDPTLPYRDAKRGRRLQRVLADGGIASRRRCEAMIEEGLVKINGTLIDFLPAWVDPAIDRISVEGHRLNLSRDPVHVMYNKPRGVLCTTRDPQGRRCVTDAVQHPSGARLFPVGRLDLESQGLLLLTNDSQLANLLTHPSHGVSKIYEVTVRGRVEEETLERLRKGVFLDDAHSRHGKGGRPKRARIESLERIRSDRDRTRLRITLAEGRNRQVRRMLAAVGHPVKRLRRVSVGPLELKGLRPGQWRDLLPRELAGLRRSARH